MSPSRREDVLARLSVESFYSSEGVELKNGKGLCPFHEDKQASLSVYDKEGHFKCHACGKSGSVFDFWMLRHNGTFADALEALAHFAGLPAAPAPRIEITPERRVIAHYAYVDEAGNMRHRTVRTEPKGFFQQRYESGQWVNGLRKEDTTYLYRLPEVIAAIAEGKTIFVVEGEKDADNLWNIGIPATTSPMGAGKWRPTYTASLAGAKVVILPDNDKVGEDHARAVADELSEAGCHVTVATLPDLPDHGDVSDWLAAGHEGTDLALLVGGFPRYQRRAAGAVVREMEGVIPVAVEWIWQDWLPRGKLTILAGEGGVGKSWLSLSIASKISTGGAWPDGSFAPKGKVIVVAGEDDLQDTIVPRLHRLGADMKNMFHFEGIDVMNKSGTLEFLDLKKHLEHFEQMVRDTRPTLIVMDPLTAYLGNVDAHNNGEVRSVLDPLAAIAARYRATICGISHLNKNAMQQKAIDRLIGSVAFGAVSRLVMNMIEDPDDDTRRIIWVSKSNLAHKPQPRAVILNGSLEWEPGYLLNVDPEQILRAGFAKKDDQIGSAIAFLEDELPYDTPIPSKEVLEHARDNGISFPTLTRAKQKMKNLRSFQKDRIWYMVKETPGQISRLRPENVDRLKSEGGQISDSHISEADEKKSDDPPPWYSDA